MNDGGCIKTRLATVQDAMRELEVAKRTWRYPPVRWYECNLCGGYHLTAQPLAKEVGGRQAARVIGDERRARDLRMRNPIEHAMERAKRG